MQAGDKNTKYFHAKTKQRRHRNRILHIEDDQGRSYSKAKDIQSHIIKYFKSLHKSNGVNISLHLLNGIPKSVTEEINRSLTRAVSEEEIKSALFAMKCISTVTYSVLINSEPT